MSVDAEHTKWWNYVDEYLSNCKQTLSITKPRQVILVVLRFESVFALHRSVLAKSARSAAYNAALQRCISASRGIIHTLSKALQGYGNFDGSPGAHGYQSTPLLWPSFTWAVWMSTFIIVFAATEKQMPRDVANKLAKRSMEVLKHLALRGTSWPEACIVAIENMLLRLNDRSRRPSRSTIAVNGPGSVLGNDHRISPSLSKNTQFLNRPSGTSSSMPPPIFLPVQSSQDAGSPPPVYNTFSPFTFSETPYTANFPAVANLASSHLAGSGTFLGIAQQLSDNPIPTHDIMHLFNYEDMGMWVREGLDFADQM